LHQSNGPRSDFRLPISLNRSVDVSLVEQLRSRIAEAIFDGTLAPGSRLPSWRDLASQMGVARGTVRQAYDDLADAHLIVADGARGTRVTEYSTRRRTVEPPITKSGSGFPYFSIAPLPLQMGVPSQAAFPTALWLRVGRQAMREVLEVSVGYPDPRGETGLRREIAAHVAITRGLVCDPEQVFVTSGYGSGLSLVLGVLELSGGSAWMEEPGYPVAREALRIAGIEPVPIPVDPHGMQVETAIALAPGARIAIVTASQHAPLGVAMSRPRRLALLDWAARRKAWIVEDDYLAELQISGRPTPALASLDVHQRTIYVGTFSKTISPSLRLGFVVVPRELVDVTTRAVAIGAPAPSPLVQHTVTMLMRDGHYLRHLRRMKALYRRNAVALHACISRNLAPEFIAGLAVLVRLQPGTDDRSIAEEARRLGFAPSALSGWYANQDVAISGLLLGVTNVDDASAQLAWRTLKRLISRHKPT
jgi:GntR family transcriptional regulator / MocR family aminotransferase